METLAVEFSGILGPIWNALCVALGLGLVIFFHELGHFAVAKWCGVQVERFSIGFGPILWSRQKGETEYALSAIPFGGYVKMLGQDDMDPGQMSDESIAENPRSYSSKKVWQRMAIISAGVIMNVVTACLFFTVAYGLGVFDSPPTVGGVLVGSPAWEQGMDLGYEITHINDEQMTSFADVSMAVALSKKNSDLKVRGRRSDGSEFELTLKPDADGNMRAIGVGPIQNNHVIQPREEGDPVTSYGLPASKADPPFLPGDTILTIDGEDASSFAFIKATLSKKAGKVVKFELQRLGDEEKPGETVFTEVPPMQFRSFGLYMEIGPIQSLQANSPAAKAGMKIGDVIQSVGGRKVGKDIDPLQLSNHLATLADTEVEVVVRRKADGSGDSDKTLKIKPHNKRGWKAEQRGPTEPFPAPAIGAAYLVTSRVAAVKDNSEAKRHGIQPGDRLVKVELVRTSESPDVLKDDNAVISLEPNPDDKKREPINWAYAYWAGQKAPQRDIVLHVQKGEETVAKTLKTWEPENGLFLPIRGFATELLLVEQKATGVGDAFRMGFQKTWKNVLQIYLTLRALFTGTISPKELHGPLGIAQVGYKVAKQGVSELMLFLGFLSVNLAVLNFLPIPILDGGHMVFLTYEAIAGKKPGERVLIGAQWLGMILILGLMFFVLFQDFSRILG